MTTMLSVFLACMNGPGSPVCPSCLPLDLDHDNDVDLRDFAMMTAPPPMTHDELLSELKKLPRLPKPHYAWPMSLSMVDPIMREYARITGSVPLWIRDDDIRTKLAADLCGEVDATVCITAMPWYAWPNPLYSVFSEAEEISELKLQLVRKKRMIQDNGASVSIVVFDCERFDLRGKSDAWKEAARLKYNLAYTCAKSVFPDATVEWFTRGERRPDTWEQPFFTLDETGDAFSFAAYRVAEPAYWRGVKRATILHASEHGVTRVHAWVALGSGWYNKPGQDERWQSSMNYPLERSWQIGSELNDPSSDIEAIFFWPRPFDPTVPWWSSHFVAYCKGATGR